MKTVSEMAKELNVSVQTVYRALNKVKQDGTDGLTEIKSNITYITSNGEQILTERFAPDKQNVEQELNNTEQVLNTVKQELNNTEQVLNTVKQELNEEIIYLREQNKAFQEELRVEREHSRQQAEKLSDLSQQLADLTRNSQILFKNEQDKTVALLPEQSEGATVKTSLFKRLFKRG